MFLITVVAVIIAALTTSFFKSVPKVEFDNISNTLIALSFGCTIILAFYNNYDHIESISKREIEEVTEEDTIEETAEETDLEGTDEPISEVPDGNPEEIHEEVPEDNTEDNK